MVNVDHIYAEEQADDAATSYLDPESTDAGVIPGGRRLIIACIELGLPTWVISSLLFVRRHRKAMPNRPLEPGTLVHGRDRHVYVIDADNRKQWIASKRLLYASGYRRKIERLSDNVLRKLTPGPHIFTSDMLRSLVPTLSHR